MGIIARNPIKISLSNACTIFAGPNGLHSYNHCKYLGWRSLSLLANSFANKSSTCGSILGSKALVSTRMRTSFIQPTGFNHGWVDEIARLNKLPREINHLLERDLH